MVKRGEPGCPAPLWWLVLFAFAHACSMAAALMRGITAGQHIPVKVNSKPVFSFSSEAVAPPTLPGFRLAFSSRQFECFVSFLPSHAGIPTIAVFAYSLQVSWPYGLGA